MQGLGWSHQCIDDTSGELDDSTKVVNVNRKQERL